MEEPVEVASGPPLKLLPSMTEKMRHMLMLKPITDIININLNILT